MESRTIKLTAAAHKYGNLNLAVCGREFFPSNVFGGSSRAKGVGVPITLKVEGLNSPIKTDIPTDEKSGRPRWIFRERVWLKQFIQFFKLAPGDRVVIRKINSLNYAISPEKKLDCKYSKIQYPLFESPQIDNRLYMPAATKIRKKAPHLRQRAVQGTFQLQNRRFLGNKYKLLGFIEEIVSEKCGSCNSFCDIFAGTGMINLKFNQIII